MKTAYIYGTLLDGFGNKTERSIVMVENNQMVYAGPMEDFVSYLDCTVPELEELVSTLREQGQLANQPTFDPENYPFPIAFHDITGKTIMPGLVITSNVPTTDSAPDNEAICIPLTEGQLIFNQQQNSEQ